jgi:hypothetical protein
VGKGAKAHQRRDAEVNDMIVGDPCIGPNHGNEHALPVGQRHWVKGYCVSLTQSVPGQADSHMIFCSADCLCDWHGAHAAFAYDQMDKPDFEIPGRFTLAWITPPSTMVRTYDDWDALTDQIGEYQARIMKQIEAREGGWVRPYEA